MHEGVGSIQVPKKKGKKVIVQEVRLVRIAKISIIFNLILQPHWG